MSFGAVVVLVAVYEILRPPVGAWLVGRHRFWRRMLKYFAGVAMTTLLAGTATGLIALFHFNRIALFSLGANMGPVPLTAIWVMPWAVAVGVLMPFGLEAIPLVPMVWVLKLIVAIATDVASWERAVHLFSAMSVWGLGLVGYGFAYGGNTYVGLTLQLLQRVSQPCPLASPSDIMVSNTVRFMAVHAADGTLSLSFNRREKFSASNWLRCNSLKRAETWPWSDGVEGPAMLCHNLDCIYQRALIEDCRTASIIISAVPVGEPCPSAHSIIDRFDLWRNGAHGI